MSQFEIAEVKLGRPSKPDPFKPLDDIFTEAQVGEARTVCLKTAEGLTEEQKKRIAQKAKGALKRYAAARGGLAGEIGFSILEGAVELWFTKRKARRGAQESVMKIGGESGNLMPEATEEAPVKPNKKRGGGSE